MKSIIDQAVDRFLGWKLPADFAPDAGITFKPLANADSPVNLQYRHEPVGTNLFTAAQAKAMFEHVLQAQPEQKPVIQDVRWYLASKLKCWHRLSGEESDQLATLFSTHPAPFTPITADMVTDEMQTEWNKVFENNPHIKDGEIFAAAVNAWGAKK